ncbi:UST [Branchiostoma lanceolatum]|uniref:UST protein n=1 Tax=Branchiostoma lanceolatum TaxID=7740 RepID=A0A8K0A4K9_BRALA|nr:UST [Branchiostoma lanceolatum]
MKAAAVVVPFTALCLCVGVWTTGLFNACYKEVVDERLPAPKQNWTKREEPERHRDDLRVWARPKHNYSHVGKVFYNRLPKCGSRAMKVLIAQLEEKNQFKFFTDKNLHAKALHGEPLLRFAQMIDKLPRPSIYEKHTYFIDFPLLDAEQPIYINLVRDPIERRVSAYYFLRYGRYGNDFAPILKLRRTEEQRNQTFDYCVVNNLKECSATEPNSFILTQYFCGQSTICTKPSQAAVEVAKENIRRHYAVVGVLEEFSSFLKVLEVVMPQFFRGASSEWKQIGSVYKENQAPIQTWVGHVQDQKPLTTQSGSNHSYPKVFYNRLPKCGSTSVKMLIRELKKRNGFKFFEDKDYEIQVLRGRNLRQFAQMVDRLPTPSIYDKHIFYVDFHQFGLQQPMYINLVRDPLEQRISDYYYMRFGRLGDNQTAQQRQRRTDEERAQTFDECVFNNLWECNASGAKGFLMTQFFCGQHSICMEPSQMAVERAKENIRRHYAVVGVLEEFSSFLKVLEVVMPQFFRGAQDTWREIESQQMEHQKTAKKIPPSGKARDIMRQRLHLDYQVYDFIKERFHMQKTQLGIKD